MNKNILYNDYGNWLDISKQNISEIKKQITGSHQNSTSYTINFKSNYISFKMKEQILNIISKTKNKNIIDFGCGVGRNIQLLKMFFNKIYGYDISDMILTFKNLNDINDIKNYNSYELVSDNLKNILNNNDIEYLYDSVVFQHIISVDYNEYIAKLISLSNIKYLFGLTSEINLYNVIQWKILIEKFNFKVIYTEIENETFGIPHLFVILEKNN